MSDLPVRVWSFSCKRPTSNAQIVWEQLKLAHKYYNDLVQIEQERRSAYRTVRSSLCPNLAEFEVKYKDVSERLDKAIDELRSIRKSVRKRVSNLELQKHISDLKAEKKQVYESLKQARDEANSNEVLEAADKKLTSDMLEKVKLARSKCGVYFGTYLLIEKAVESSKSSQADQKFHRWDGNGRIGVQLQNKPTVKDIFDQKSTMIQINPVSPEAYFIKNGKQKVRPPLSRSKVRIRVGSDKSRNPIWAEFPITLHRKLPDDAIITWAWISTRRIGLHTEFELQLTLESNEFVKVRPTSGAIAFDLGWRVRPDGIRVGFVVGNDGFKQEILVPNHIQTALEHSSKLIGYSDEFFNVALSILSEAIKSKLSGLPNWMPEATLNISQWRMHGKLASIVNRWLTESDKDLIFKICSDWKNYRFSSKLDLFATKDEIFTWANLAGIKDQATQLLFYLELWRRKDRHLIQWAADQRKKTISNRQHLYRNIASNLSQRYKTLVVEDMDLRKFIKNSTPENENPKDYTHCIMSIGSPGELRLELIQAFGKPNIIKVDPENTTRECHLCGHINKWKNQEILVLQCSNCEKYWDQDENACHILLKRCEQSNGSPNPGVSRKPNGPSEKQLKNQERNVNTKSNKNISQNANETALETLSS
jgi:hypothetical protein